MVIQSLWGEINLYRNKLFDSNSEIPCEIRLNKVYGESDQSLIPPFT